MNEKRMSAEGLTVAELCQLAQEKRVRIEVEIIPEEVIGVRRNITIEPWEPYEPKCPIGQPIVYVTEGKAEG